MDDDLSNLPCALPMLDIVLQLDSGLNVIECFKIDEVGQSMSLGKSFDISRAMFGHAPDKIVRDADVEDAIRSVGQKVDIAAFHGAIMEGVDGRDKPGHDEIDFVS
jgi:hypothetical protein